MDNKENQEISPEERRRRLAENMTREITRVDMESERDFIDNLMGEIVEPLKKVPEPVFKEIFLPYFTGEKKATEKDAAIAHWIGLVNGGTEAAEVVNMKGEVLFVVPPLYDSSNIDTLKKAKGRSFSSIFTEFTDQASVHRGTAIREMTENLAEKLDSVVKTETPADSDKPSWGKIRQYYGLAGAPEVKSATPARKTVEEDPDFDF